MIEPAGKRAAISSKYRASARKFSSETPISAYSPPRLRYQLGYFPTNVTFVS